MTVSDAAPPTPNHSTPGDLHPDLIRYARAVGKLDALIEPSPPAHDRGLAAVRTRAVRRLARVRDFLDYLGNPHRAAPVVHVGGTSGKGSTSTAIAAILTAAGYQTGLHTSPYLQVASEKMQIDGRLIAVDDFANLVDEVLAAADAWRAANAVNERLTYGEIWVALVALWFARERVDVAVIEVGAGGRFDLTNVVQPAVSVITSVGLDHTATLGPTIAAIAWHKAGIIKPGAPIVTAVRSAEALVPILAEAERASVPVVRVKPGETFEVTEAGPAAMRWREIAAPGRPQREYQLALASRVQAQNEALAVATVRALADRGFPVDEKALQAGLRAARLPGRFEMMPDQGGPPTLIDGAHNPQKMAALSADLASVFPPAGDRLPVLLFGALDGKDVAAMVRLLAPRCEGFVATTPSVLGKRGLPATSAAATARELGVRGSVMAEPDPAAAFAVARDLAKAAGAPLLVTGSLYLAGEARGHWYPDEAILLGRTPWPVVP